MTCLTNSDRGTFYNLDSLRKYIQTAKYVEGSEMEIINKNCEDIE